jgi:hypothetical protein
LALLFFAFIARERKLCGAMGFASRPRNQFLRVAGFVFAKPGRDFQPLASGPRAAASSPRIEKQLSLTRLIRNTGTCAHKKPRFDRSNRGDIFQDRVIAGRQSAAAAP